MNMKLSYLKLLIGVTLALILSLNPVSSLGVAPSSYTSSIDEVPDQYKLRILNSEQKDYILDITPVGDLAEYVRLDQETVRLLPTDTDKTIYYTLDLPENLPPGPQSVSIRITEVDAGQNAGVVVGSITEIGQRVTVYTPYAGTHLTGELFVNGNAVNAPVTFTVHLINRGSAPSRTSGNIQILGPTNELLGVVQIPEQTIASGANVKVQVPFAGLPNQGQYKARANVFYGDSESLTLEKNFALGDVSVTVTSIDVGEFEIGDIAKLSIGLLNNWNQPMDDVYADLNVYTLDGRLLSQFRTAPINLQAFQTGTVDAFWDTDGIPLGSYTVEITVNFEGTQSRYIYDAAVNVNSISITGQGLSGQVIATRNNDGSGNDNLLTLIVILLIVVIAINVFYLTIVQKLLKKDKK